MQSGSWPHGRMHGKLALPAQARFRQGGAPGAPPPPTTPAHSPPWALHWPLNTPTAAARRRRRQSAQGALQLAAMN
jgi:hypothetical protein